MGIIGDIAVETPIGKAEEERIAKDVHIDRKVKEEVTLLMGMY